jgi:DNA-binding transcriptional regulator YbjK
MGSRRDDLLDAAIELLGERGVRGLTHRAVDAAAGRPPGSTSNYFRTSDALLLAVIDRFADRERAALDDLAAGLHPAGPAEVAELLAAAVRASSGPNRTLTLARYAILLEGAQRPALRERLIETGGRVNVWAASWLKAAGSLDPERDAAIVQNYIVGVVLHQLARPRAGFDPGPAVTALVEALVGQSHGA